MKKFRIWFFYFIWYLACVALLFWVTRIIKNVTDGNRWPLLVLLLVEIGAALLFSIKQMISGNAIGKVETFVLLVLLVCGSFVTFAYVSLVIYGA